MLFTTEITEDTKKLFSLNFMLFVSSRCKWTVDVSPTVHRSMSIRLRFF
jgi:hypothetical protein